MAEIATLGLRVDGTANIDGASKSLDRFSQSGRTAEQSTGTLTRESQKSSKSLAAVARESDRASGGMTRLANVARRAGGLLIAAVGGFSFARLIGETARFEDAMLGLAAVSGATAGQMAELEKQARTLGATSMFSAQQAGDAQRFLAQAGFEVNEVLSATPGILQLATAGQIDLGTAADIASNVLGGMRLEVDQLNRVNDVLAATAARSNTNIQQLGQALSFAAPFAAGAGVSIEEAAAAIGNMSDAGIQASRAGTGLVGVIRQLSNVTTAGSDVLSRYGLSVADVNIEARGLEPVLATLSKANLTTADAIALFGSEAGAAAQVLVNDYSGAVTNATGEAERMALIIGGGLTGSMRGFNSMLSESLLQLGDSGLAGGFSAVTDRATGLLAVYNDMLPEFAEANDLTEDQASSLQRLADGLSTTATIAGGAIAAIVAYRGAVATATVAQIAFNTAVTANPLGLIVTLAGAAAGALYYYRDELGLVDVAAQNAARALEENANAIRDGSAAALDANYDSLVNSLEAVSLQAQEAMAQLVELEARQKFYENAHKGVADSVAGAIGQQAGALADLWERQVQLQTAIERNREARAELTAADREGAEALDTVTVTASRASSEIDKLSKSQRDAQQEADRFANSLQSLVDALFPVEAAQRTYREEQEILTRAWNEGTITAERYTEAMQRLERAQLSAQTASGAYGGGGGFGSEIGSRGEAGSPTDPLARNDEDEDYWTKWLESAETALTDFDSIAANTAENFQRGFGDAFEAMVFDSQNFGDAMYNLFDGIARSLVSALGEMAAQWLAYQAVQLIVGKTTQATAASGIVANALVQQQVAGLNAYASTAAIPIVGPVAAPAAMAAAIAATTPSVTAITALSAAGMAHDGIDRIPREGTWLLDQGERVVSRPQADRLDAYLSRQDKPQQAAPVAPVVNITTPPGTTAQTESRLDRDEKWVIDVYVNNMNQGGRADKANRVAYGLSRQGV